MLTHAARANDLADRVCPRPQEGAVVQEPPIVASKNGKLDVTLRYRSVVDAEGATRFCYLTKSGLESPTLKLSPGDRLAIHLQNNLPPAAAMPGMIMAGTSQGPESSGCHGAMTASATNIHLHGVTVPPQCHQDESIHTLIAPGHSFDYSMQISPANPPGLYWYHPHPHGFSTAQVQGGASGAMIVDGIQSAVPALGPLPERTFILRDQLLAPSQADNPDPLKPSWDISLNYVPVKFPKYLPAVVQTAPGERQFWRFVNSAANTIFHLQVLYDNQPQTLDVYAIDGVPLLKGPVAQTSIFLPPGSRAEFVVTTPAVGQTAQIVTQKHDPGPAGDSAPARPIANIVASTDIVSKPKEVHASAKLPSLPGSLQDLQPVQTRSLYFSQNGNGTEGGAGAADKFYLTVVGQPMKLYDMAGPAKIVAHQGTVEDWNLTNMTPEDHIFHIHQVHFQLIAVNGIPVDDPVVRDTILVPHQVGRTPISSIKVRLDFRDPSIVGTFVYHCHILDHEDKGMMGSIQILPAEASLQP
jgi:FtsP/CotA-like multicopper oxidase with cupredoxin domain